MPLKPITFDHNGQTINAQLMFNLSEIPIGVTVLLTNAIEGVKQSILFVPENGVWTTTSDIAKLHPITTEQIIDCLKKALACEEGLDHILAVYDLLS
jgi:hypothetical protein